ncbi:MAG: substrate-binding domain-containing protein [Candidatus Omnitrophota bacterium]
MKRISIIPFLALMIFGLNCECFALDNHIKMATTTSVENSGLLDILLPAFKNRYGITINAISVGTGKALKLAENGDVDIVLVHAPAMEKDFIDKGFGIDRTTVFYNDFVLIGPKEDPAGIEKLKSAGEAFKKIAQGEQTFVSRGDNSGTHLKEIDTWNSIGIFPKGREYIETGQGMGTTLQIADEKRGYCLVDRGTFISYKNKIDLVILFEGDPSLGNPYSLIVTNPARYPGINYKKAKLFIEWLTSEEGNMFVSDFRKNGEILFKQR